MEEIKSMPKKNARRIMIVDDHSATRFGVVQLIASTADLKVCGEASSIHEAMRQIQGLNPDLILVDLSLEDGSGLDLIEQVRRHYPEIKCLVLSMYAESFFADRALQAGAAGYLCKSESIHQIVEAIRQVLKGKMFLTEAMSERILRRRVLPQDNSVGSFTDKLSNRELEIFQLIGEGRTRSQLAKQLHLSVKTIETHQENIKKKLNLESNQEIVCRAVAWILENKRLSAQTKAHEGDAR